MLHNPKHDFRPARAFASPTSEARRLRTEYNRLQRRLGALDDQSPHAHIADGLKAQVERVARELSQLRADSVQAIEAKLRVALDLKGESGDPTSNRLLSSALTDLRYLAMLTPPPSA